ncbi:hypothetical protein GOODEAATRI_033896 [Goodea atripinnis]|uniref:Uncharacterized protein n=1 Tax=Goodea atripinnis TaxID=208336 RepID=A0ABV0N6H3_9TELE
MNKDYSYKDSWASLRTQLSTNQLYMISRLHCICINRTELEMGTKFGTFIGTDQIPLVLQSTDSHKIKRYHVLVPKRIIVTLREWKSGRFSMPDMNTALHAQQHNDVSSRCYRQQSKHGCRQALESMAPLFKMRCRLRTLQYLCREVQGQRREYF